MIVAHRGENSEVRRRRQFGLGLRRSATVQPAFTGNMKPLIHVAAGSLIGADQRNKISANRRFLLLLFKLDQSELKIYAA